jgi:hypothetical protein
MGRAVIACTCVSHTLHNREKRRAEIADALISQTNVVPPGRLLALIGNALKYQKLQVYSAMHALASREHTSIMNKAFVVILVRTSAMPRCAVLSEQLQCMTTITVGTLLLLLATGATATTKCSW